MPRRLQVEIVGDARSLRGAFGQAGDAGDRFGRRMRTAGKAAAIGIAGGLVAAGAALKVFGGEALEAERVAALTDAVLKSTGGAANVTAKQVDQLATALMRKSGIDDEAIKSGENMLLTFTRIRNEVGAGNNIFDQATAATLNLSVAMGKDMQSSAILVGKALNDPLRGVGALTKAGVQFTAQQKAQIKALVGAGKTMQAQKVILAELSTQFGGAAEAAGKTLRGRINLLRESLLNMGGAVVAKLIPSLTRFTMWMTGIGLPAIGRFGRALGEKLTPIAKRLGDVFRKAVGAISDAVRAHMPMIRALFDDFGRALRRIADVAMPSLKFAWDKIVKPALKGLKKALEVTVDSLGGTRLALLTMGAAISLALTPKRMAKLKAFTGNMKALKRIAKGGAIALTLSFLFEPPKKFEKFSGQVQSKKGKSAWRNLWEALKAGEGPAVVLTGALAGLSAIVGAFSFGLLFRGLAKAVWWLRGLGKSIGRVAVRLKPLLRIARVGGILTALTFLFDVPDFAKRFSGAKGWGEAAKLFAEGWDRFVRGAKSIGGDFAKLWELIRGPDAVAGLVSGIKAGWDEAKGPAGELKDIIVGAVGDSKDWLTGVGGALVGGLLAGSEAAWNAQTWFSGLRGLITGAVGDGVGWLRSTGTAALNSLRNAASDAWDAQDWFASTAGRVKNAVGNGVGWLRDTGEAALDSLRNAASGTWATVRGWFAGVKGLVVGAVGTGVGWLRDTGTAALNSLKAAALATWGTVIEWFAGLKGLVFAAVGPGAGWLALQGGAAIGSLRSAAVATWEAIKEWFDGVKGRVTGAVGDGIGWLSDTGAAAIRSLRNGAMGVWGEVSAWWQAAKNTIVGWFASLPGSLLALGTTAGRSIVKGLREGLSGIGSVLDLLRKPLDALIGAWNKVADILGKIKDVAKEGAKKIPSLPKVPTIPFGPILPFAQAGGSVAATGAAVVHRGETIVPRGGGGGWPEKIVLVMPDGRVLAEVTRKELLNTARRNVTAGLA